jgi:hypothetical protein
MEFVCFCMCAVCHETAVADTEAFARGNIKVCSRVTCRSFPVLHVLETVSVAWLSDWSCSEHLVCAAYIVGVLRLGQTVGMSDFSFDQLKVNCISECLPIQNTVLSCAKLILNGNFGRHALPAY